MLAIIFQKMENEETKVGKSRLDDEEDHSEVEIEDDDGASDGYDSGLEMNGKAEIGLNIDAETDYQMEIAEIERLLKSAETKERRQALASQKKALEQKRDIAESIRVKNRLSGLDDGAQDDLADSLNSQGSGKEGSSSRMAPSSVDLARKTKLFEAAPLQRPASARPRSARQRSISLKAIPEDATYSRRGVRRLNSRQPSFSTDASNLGNILDTGTYSRPPILAIKTIGTVEENLTHPSSPNEGEVCELPRSVFSEVWGTCSDLRHPPDHALSNDRRRFWLSTGGFPQAIFARTQRRLTIYKVTVSAINVKQLALHIEDSQSRYIDACVSDTQKSPSGRSHNSSVITLPPPHRHVTSSGEVSRKWEAFSHTFEVGPPGQGREALGFRLHVESGYHDFAAIQNLQILGMVAASSKGSI